MTRTKLVRAVSLTLARHAGEDAAQQAAAVADAIEMLLEIEAAEADQPIDISSFRRESPAKPKSIPLPVSPAVTAVDNQSGSGQVAPLIVAPDSPEAAEVFNKPHNPSVAPGRGALFAPAPGAEIEGVPIGRSKAYWKLDDLKNAIYENTPPTIRIAVNHEQRGEVPITLERNIEVGPGFDCIKLSYKHESAGNEMAASETFTTMQQSIPIPEVLEKIHSSAVKIYSPRQGAFAPLVPINQAPMMTYDSIGRVRLSGFSGTGVSGGNADNPPS